MRAAYIGGGPTNVPYVPNPALFHPFSPVSSLSPTPSAPPSPTLSSVRSVLDISRPIAARFNHAFEEQEIPRYLKDLHSLISVFVKDKLVEI